jgi:hypothetical protein
MPLVVRFLADMGGGGPYIGIFLVLVAVMGAAVLVVARLSRT